MRRYFRGRRDDDADRMKHYYLARLGGADRRLLAAEEAASHTGERGRAAAMGGVLLTTAGVATVSMFFALHHGVGISTGWAIPFALAWGIVIINLDRFLITTLAGARGHPVRLFVTVLWRVLLAALIAFVVATPLVLVVFASDINAQIPAVQEQQSKAFALTIPSSANGKALKTVENNITKTEAEIKTQQSQVTNLFNKKQEDDNKAAVAYRKWQCESGGLKGSQCPPGTSGRRGYGPLARGDHRAYESDEANYNAANSQYQAANRILGTEQGQLYGKGGLEDQKAGLQEKINKQIANDNNRNSQDKGLLIQIQALDEASSLKPGLAVAHWTVTALFFVIEILPVSVKCMLLIGKETPYEKIVAMKEKAAIEQAERLTSAENVAARVRAQSIQDTAMQEVQHQEAIRAAERQTELAAAAAEQQKKLTVAQEKMKAEESAELEVVRHHHDTQLDANERLATKTREYIIAAVDDWARELGARINYAAQQQSPNGQSSAAVDKTPGYDPLDGDSV